MEMKQENLVKWKQDKRWSDKFLHEIKGYIGQALLCEPPVEEDVERNSDLMVLKMNNIRIGCRVRTNYYLNKYPDEFTIRSSRPSGNKTELAKIIEGWGDYFFYGFSNKEETEIEKWFIGDLKVFRLWFATYLRNNKGEMPGMFKMNKDGSSNFIALRISDIPDNFVIASSAMSCYRTKKQ